MSIGIKQAIKIRHQIKAGKWNAVARLEYDVLWGSPMTANDLKLKVLEDYQHVLGLAQKIGTLTYTTKLILMGVK